MAYEIKQVKVVLLINICVYQLHEETQFDNLVSQKEFNGTIVIRSQRL